MEDYIDAIDQMTAQLGDMRARRNTMLVHRQVVSTLDSELSKLELQVSFLSRMTDPYDFPEQHQRVQNAIDETARTWFTFDDASHY